jgi:hypothetical protein
VIRLAGIVLAAAALAAGGATLSGADFVSGSAAPGNAFAAASDFNTVAVSIVDPGTPLRGTKTLQAIATSEREIDHVTFQSAPAGTTTWADACTTAPTVSLTDPGAVLTGTMSLAAIASDTGGVSSVAFERSVAGANTWVSISTDNATPFTCSFATTALADGCYDLRALATDAAGDQGTSVVAGVRLENTTPTGTDVQTGNGGSAAGLLEAGDWIRLTWSEPLAPASILTGWAGAAQAIRVTVTNSANNDRMDFTTTGGTRLNLVSTATSLQLRANFVTATATFDATMVQSGTSVTVTLGARLSGTTAAAGTGTITWQPSASATDLSNKAVSTATVTETGAVDKDF